MYTKDEVITYVIQEDVKFIRLAFCDVFGTQKNIAIMPNELDRAFNDGILFDSSAIKGFGSIERSDLLLFPDPSTLSDLPWRPVPGRVVRLYCDIKYPNGRPYEVDGRHILRQAVKAAQERGIAFLFGAEYEFYLFKTDENGDGTNIPHDNAGYMDIAPEDKGENLRREICFMLEKMGIIPQSSHHEEGPGQHEIHFRCSEALSAADNATTFKSVVRTTAARNGLYASFEPKPFEGISGSGFHINISAKSEDGKNYTNNIIAGILAHIEEITVFLNPSNNSYKRLGEKKAPKYIGWAEENRSALVRIPAAKGECERIELRSPDAGADPYLAYSLLIYAALDGIKNNLTPAKALNENLFEEQPDAKTLKTLPENLEDAAKIAQNSSFVNNCVNKKIIKAYTTLPR
ncbi:MAG: glutamine synthetase [Eubacteriaceae bacterium]|nr:glutamine synthetase [Eubacteriaceae bacterium]